MGFMDRINAEIAFADARRREREQRAQSPSPRDYRAERDALRLRLDDALDRLARYEASGNRWKVVADYAGATSAELRAKLDAAESAYVTFANAVAPLFGTRTP